MTPSMLSVKLKLILGVVSVVQVLFWVTTRLAVGAVVSTVKYNILEFALLLALSSPSITIVWSPSVNADSKVWVTSDPFVAVLELTTVPSTITE